MRALALAAVLLLAGCVPTVDDPGIGTCDPVLLERSIEAGPVITAEPLGEAGFPFDDLADEGFEPTCTARFDVDGTATDVALYDVPRAILVRNLGLIGEQDDWTVDSGPTGWETPDHVIRAFEIEEGVLVGVRAP